MGRMRLFAAAAVATVVLLAGGSAGAGSPAGQAPTRGACLSDVTSSAVAVFAPDTGKLRKVLAPAVTGSFELRIALGTAITCADQAEKALEAPAPAVRVPAKAHLSPGVPRCARE